jgi:hypothetical protein
VENLQQAYALKASAAIKDLQQAAIQEREHVRGTDGGDEVLLAWAVDCCDV